MMKINYIKIMAMFSLFLAFNAMSANVKTIFKLTPEKYTQAQVINKGGIALNCYIAIDGYKLYFHLAPRGKSTWYKATDRRFNYMQFSTKCKQINL